jgi:hypothetical protein
MTISIEAAWEADLRDDGRHLVCSWRPSIREDERC